MARKSSNNTRLARARLRELMVDPLRFTADEDDIAPYLRPGIDPGRIIAVIMPRSQSDIEHALEVARNYRLAVYTPQPWGIDPGRSGFIIDFKYMADVLSLDPKRLFLEVEPGVTWEQVLPALEAQGVRVALPAAGHSPYVLESALERDVVLPASRFSNRQLATFHVLLADGREYRSGSDALPNSIAHWREDGGPNISRIFTGSRNSFGIPLRGYVYLYPESEARKVVVRGFTTRKQACAMAQRAARAEMGTEVVILNKAKAKQVVGDDTGLEAWNLVLGLEGSSNMVAYYEKRLGELAVELKLKPKGVKAVESAMAEALDRPWYAPDLSLGFYTNFSRVEELSGIVESALKGKGGLAQMLVPVKHGASVYLQFDVPESGNGAGGAVEKLLFELADAGAFFPNPTGALAAHVFGKQPVYLRLLKDIKRFMDPDDVLNPGQVVEV
jgi:FAD/FMN-containing dehydrogenase